MASTDLLRNVWRLAIAVIAGGVAWFSIGAYRFVESAADEPVHHLAEGAARGLLWGLVMIIAATVVALLALLVVLTLLVDLRADWSSGAAAGCAISLSIAAIIPFGALALFGSEVALGLFVNSTGLLILSLWHRVSVSRRELAFVAQPPPPRPAGWQPPPPTITRH